MNETQKTEFEEMKNSIAKLQSEFDEIGKRISSIFESHTTTTQLTSIKQYFNSIQEYLQNLLTSFNTHIDNCVTYSTQISQLQNEVSTINSTLETLESLKNLNATEIENLITKFNSFMGENDTTLDTLINDISSLQTDLGAMQETIDSINTEISSINLDIGSMQTTITNLSSTQNSLSSAQNSMSANINSIDSRLTTAENNISALTGGVDVGEFDSRITTLEDENGFNNHYAYKKATYNLTPTDFKLFTPEYYFCSTTNGYTELKINLNYTNISATKLYIYFILNKNTIKTYTVDLTSLSNNFQIVYKYKTSLIGQSVKINCTANNCITFDNLELELYGSKVHFFDYDKNLKVHCFDNQVFITKKENGIAHYGLFSSTDAIDLGKLPNQKAFQSDDGSYLTIEYVPFSASSNGYYTEYVYAMYTENANNERYLSVLDNNNTSNSYLVDKPLANNGYYNDIFWTIGGAPYMLYFNPATKLLYGTLATTNLNSYNYNLTETNLDENWVYVTSVSKNFNLYNSNCLDRFYVKAIAINKDGNAYLLNKKSFSNVLKIGKGLYVTAYEHEDESINVYLSDYEKTYKYKLELNSSSEYVSTYITTIKDCDCIYETFNNKIIKHMVSTNTWEVDTLEY